MSTKDDSTTQFAIAMTFGAFALVFLFFALALAIYPGWPEIGNWADKTDSPSWIQAFGSIGAILATGAAGAWQSYITHRVFAGQRQDAKESDVKLSRQRKQMVLTAAGYVRYVAQQQIERMNAEECGNELLAVAHNLQRLREYCERLPIWSMGNNALAGRWGGILEAVANAESALIFKTRDVDTALQDIVHLCRRLNSDFSNDRDELLTRGEDMGWI